MTPDNNPGGIMPDSCPFCGNGLTYSSGRMNKVGYCDTEDCWLHERKVTVPLDDPRQVAAFNTRALFPSSQSAAESNPIVASLVRDAIDVGSDDAADLAAARIGAYFAAQEPRGCPTPGACSCPPQSPPVVDAGLHLEAETYRAMHVIATEDLGYPSILDALEATPHANMPVVDAGGLASTLRSDAERLEFRADAFDDTENAKITFREIAANNRAAAEALTQAHQALREIAELGPNDPRSTTIARTGEG